MCNTPRKEEKNARGARVANTQCQQERTSFNIVHKQASGWNLMRVHFLVGMNKQEPLCFFYTELYHCLLCAASLVSADTDTFFRHTGNHGEKP